MVAVTWVIYGGAVFQRCWCQKNKAGQCRTNPWPAVPDWLYDTGRPMQDRRSWLPAKRLMPDFFLAFRHTLMLCQHHKVRKFNTTNSCIWTCRMYSCPPPLAWTTLRHATVLDWDIRCRCRRAASVLMSCYAKEPIEDNPKISASYKLPASRTGSRDWQNYRLHVWIGLKKSLLSLVNDIPNVISWVTKISHISWVTKISHCSGRKWTASRGEKTALLPL